MCATIIESSGAQYFISEIGMTSCGEVFDGADCISCSTSAGVTGASFDSVEVGLVHQTVSVGPRKDRRPSLTIVVTESSL